MEREKKRRREKNPWLFVENPAPIVVAPQLPPPPIWYIVIPKAQDFRQVRHFEGPSRKAVISKFMRYHLSLKKPLLPFFHLEKKMEQQLIARIRSNQPIKCTHEQCPLPAFYDGEFPEDSSGKRALYLHVLAHHNYKDGLYWKADGLVGSTMMTAYNNWCVPYYCHR